MEFYELLEEITEAVPAGYENIAALLTAALPWVMGICALATCFFGHKVHKIWNAFFFFWIGFLTPVFVIGLLASPEGFWMELVILLGVVTGGVCAFFSKKLLKLQLFVTTFFLAFAALPSYLLFLGEIGSVAVGFLGAVAAGVLSMKYKYIMTLVTTSFTGASLFFVPVQAKTALSDGAAAILSLLLGAAGLAVQIFIERKELQESGEAVVNGFRTAKKKLTARKRVGETAQPLPDPRKEAAQGIPQPEDAAASERLD